MFKTNRILVASLFLILTTVGVLAVTAQRSVTPAKKVLMVLTSTSTLGNTGQRTGFHFSEATYPHDVFTRAGFEVDFVSPNGGEAPRYYVDLKDRVNLAFFMNPFSMDKVKNTFNPSQINPANYHVIFYVGGTGAMWDLPHNKKLDQIAVSIYEQGGIVAAICHGPAGLVNARLSNGKYLIDGKTLTSFSNEEEEASGLIKVVPFLLETALIDRGARFVKAAVYQPKVVVSERLVTGQNPASALEMSDRIVKLLQNEISSPSS